MKILKNISAMFIAVSFLSAMPAHDSKNKVSKEPEGCTYALNIDNQGNSTITSVDIVWTGVSSQTYPVNVPSLSTGTVYLPVTPNAPLKYLVKVTVHWATPATGPKLRLYANSPLKLIGAFNGAGPTTTLISAQVSGNNPNGPTATYCQGVTVIVYESI